LEIIETVSALPRSSPARVVLVDDHPLFRFGLRTMLDRESRLDCVGEAATADETMVLAESMRIDVALVDVVLPASDGVALTSRLHALQPDCKILGLSVIDEPIRISEMLRAGASGYALKTQPVHEIIGAIATVLGGIRYLPPSVPREAIDELEHAAVRPLETLTRREREILGFLLRGHSNDQIATLLFIARRTVETHRQRILRKLNVHTIVELVHFAARHGLR
jgi:DNA-binding NarL/FixJ family response regulator